MTHLSTEVVTPCVFTRHDFDQAVTLFQRINKDGDNVRPEHDAELKAWITHWYPVLATLNTDDNQQDYIALPVDDRLIFSPPETYKGACMMTWRHPYPLLLVGVAMLINLSQCERFSEIESIIHYFRGKNWCHQSASLSRFVAITMKANFCQALGQLICEQEAQHHEN